MGPLWDFDWSIGWQMNETHYDYYKMRKKLYYQKIYKNTDFIKHVANLHLTLRSKLEENINNIYDSLYVTLRKSAMLDDKIWWHAYTLDWDKEIQTDRSYLLGTLHFLDAQLKPYMDETEIATIKENPLPNCKVLYDGHLYIIKGSNIYDCIGIKKILLHHEHRWTSRSHQ